MFATQDLPGLNDHLSTQVADPVKAWDFEGSQWGSRQIPEPIRSILLGRDRKSMKRAQVLPIPSRFLDRIGNDE